MCGHFLLKLVSGQWLGDFHVEDLVRRGDAERQGRREAEFGFGMEPLAHGKPDASPAKEPLEGARKVTVADHSQIALFAESNSDTRLSG